MIIKIFVDKKGSTKVKISPTNITFKMTGLVHLNNTTPSIIPIQIIMSCRVFTNVCQRPWLWQVRDFETDSLSARPDVI